MEPWERPNWYADRNLSSAAAAKILRKRLENYGPQSKLQMHSLNTRIFEALTAAACSRSLCCKGAIGAYQEAQRGYDCYYNLENEGIQTSWQIFTIGLLYLTPKRFLDKGVLLQGVSAPSVSVKTQLLPLQGSAACRRSYRGYAMSRMQRLL